MGGNAFTKIENTGGGAGLRENSQTSGRLYGNQVAPGRSEKEGLASVGDVCGAQRRSGGWS